MDVSRLQRALLNAITPKPQPTITLFHVSPIRFTVAEVVQSLSNRLPGTRRRTFRQLTAELVERLDVIVHFLALLELFKQGLVELSQGTRFGDLEVEWIGSAEKQLVGSNVDEYEG